jgi:hypothetical protein
MIAMRKLCGEARAAPEAATSLLILLAQTPILSKLASRTRGAPTP